MGTSTVSGPFRSENGFQELVDGVWTPVGGGGGGGGGAEVLILPRVATNTYFTIATTVPEVGKQWKLILAPYFYAPQGGTLQALFAIPEWGGDYTFYGAAATIWATNSSIHGMNFSPSSGNITSLYFDNGNYLPDQVLTAEYDLTYMGMFTGGSGQPTAFISITGFKLIGGYSS